MKVPSPVALLVLAALVLGGCGGDGSQAEAGDSESPGRRTVGLVFDGRVDGANVVVRLGEKRGYFKELGRDVWSGSPARPAHVDWYVSTAVEDFGIISLPQFLLAKEEGESIVVVGSLVPRSTIAMIWLKKSGIRSVADLKGKTIAVPGLPFQERLLEVVLKRAGLAPGDVKVKRVGYELLPVLLGGRADAIFGGSWNIQGAALKARGLEPVIRRAPALGIPNYDERVFFTRKNLAEKEPDLVRDFIAGVTRGSAAAAADPAAAAKLLEDDEADPEATKKTSKAELKATLPLLSKTGLVDPVRLEKLERWMQEEGMIRRVLPVSELLADADLSSP